MKNLILTLCTTLLFISVNNAHAQSMQEILDKHFKAIGQEKLLEINTYTVKASVKQMGMEIPMYMQIKRPNKFRLEMEMQGQKMIQAYDGKKGWMIAPWISQEPQELSGPQLEQAMEQTSIDGELYNYADKGFTALLIGKVNMEGAPVFNIQLTDKEGNIKDYFIDAETHLIKKVKAKVSSQGQEFEIEQFMKEYKDIDGIKIASNLETKTPMGVANTILEEIKFGEEIDDSVFSKP